MKFPALSDSTKETIKAVGGVLLICAALAASYYAGFTKGTQESRNIVVEGVTDPTRGNAVDFSVFWEAWSVLKSKYVDQTAADDNKALLYGAISGLVSALNDPNTSFFTPRDATKFNEDIKGEFGGIGAEIGLDKSGQLIIVAPLKNTPAFRVGLRPGDKIMAIDKETTEGIMVEEAVTKIRGPAGTVVTLTIARDGTEAREVPITREIITIPTLDFKMLNLSGQEDAQGDIAYIQLHNFYEQAPYQFYQASLKTLIFGADGIILDLRNNPGGYLDAAVSISGWFVKKGDVVVKEDFRDDALNETFVSQGPSLLKDIPTVVLINKGSASASEIVAGALKENNGAVVIGQKSFGKGTVQELVNLMDNSMVKVTVARWLTPKGNMIDQNGITPDIEVPEPEESPQNTQSDILIQKALEILKSK